MSPTLGQQAGFGEKEMEMTEAEQRMKALLEDMYTPKQLEEIVDMTQRMGIMIALLNCGSIDREILCAQIYKDKNELIPMAMIEDAYDQKLILMVGEEINNVNGVWSIDPELLPLVMEHKANLEGETIPEGSTIN